MIPGYANASAQFQMQMSDYQQAQTIQTQIASDAQKQQMERWKILHDTQTKIFEIQQDVTVNKAKTQDKMYNKWDEYIRS
jgi:vacuolar-type H+-ATPase subunit H